MVDYIETFAVISVNDIDLSTLKHAISDIVIQEDKVIVKRIFRSDV